MATLKQKLARMFQKQRTSGGDGGGTATATAVEVSPRSGRETTGAELKRGYNEMLDTVQALRRHMDEQAQRSQRLLDLMEGLPEALRSLPELTRHQTRTLEAIHGQIQGQSESTQRLGTALSELATATSHQQAAIGQMHDQMQANRQSSDALMDSLGGLSETMGRMTDASRANVDAVNRIAEQTAANESRTTELFRRSQKHATAMSAVSWSLALAALAVAGYVAVMVGGRAGTVADAGATTPRTPAATTPVNDAPQAAPTPTPTPTPRAAEPSGDAATASAERTRPGGIERAGMSFTLPAAPAFAPDGDAPMSEGVTSGDLSLTASGEAQAAPFSLFDLLANGDRALTGPLTGEVAGEALLSAFETDGSTSDAPVEPVATPKAEAASAPAEAASEGPDDADSEQGTP